MAKKKQRKARETSTNILLVFVLGFCVFFIGISRLFSLNDIFPFIVVVIGAALIASYINTIFKTRRIKQLHKDEVAAYLHDSVLQTLVLIEKTANDPNAVRSLARAQERELREWLYDDKPNVENGLLTVAQRLKLLVQAIEEERNVDIDFVAVGDVSADDTHTDGGIETTEALLAATAQATLNATQHGEPPVSVYFEATPISSAPLSHSLKVYIRDHGTGFNFSEIPASRMGIRTSICERIEKVGGVVTIKSRKDFGTEISLEVKI